jgi:DNA polymerase V
MGPTKTLAKLANFAAKKWKKTGGVLDLSDNHRRQKLMSIVPVEEVWGIGRKISRKLNEMGIHTVLDLAGQPPERIQKQFNILVARTVMELNGIACIELEDIAPYKQQIISSRSFGQKLTTYAELAKALADYASRATEKLRRQHSVTAHIAVFIHTNPFSDTDKQYQNSAATNLILPAQDTRYIVETAIRLLGTIYKDGFNYHKCGIVLSAIQRESSVAQTDLFNDNLTVGSSQLMSTLDAINQKYPKSLRIAAAGFDTSWKANSNRITKRYTTDWRELVEVK